MPCLEGNVIISDAEGDMVVIVRGGLFTVEVTVSISTTECHYLMERRLKQTSISLGKISSEFQYLMDPMNSCFD